MARLPKRCTTNVRGSPYPCQLQMLPGFEDVSYKNDVADSVSFVIGEHAYRLWIGEDDAEVRAELVERVIREWGYDTFGEYLEDRKLTEEQAIEREREDSELHSRFVLQSWPYRARHAFGDVEISERMESYDYAFGQPDFEELETNSEAELMRHLGVLWVAQRKRQLGMRPNVSKQTVQLRRAFWSHDHDGYPLREPGIVPFWYKQTLHPEDDAIFLLVPDPHGGEELRVEAMPEQRASWDPDLGTFSPWALEVDGKEIGTLHGDELAAVLEAADHNGSGKPDWPGAVRRWSISWQGQPVIVNRRDDDFAAYWDGHPKALAVRGAVTPSGSLSTDEVAIELLGADGELNEEGRDFLRTLERSLPGQGRGRAPSSLQAASPPMVPHVPPSPRPELPPRYRWTERQIKAMKEAGLRPGYDFNPRTR